MNKRSIAIVVAVAALFAPVGTAAAEPSFIGTFERVCLSTKGDYDAVVRTMSSLSGWTEGRHPGGTHIERVKAWVFTDASPQAVAVAFELREGMALGVGASLLKSGTGGLVPDCSLHGVIDPKFIRDALTTLGFTAVGGHVGSPDDGHMEILVTTERRPGLTNVHLLNGH